ncbi:tyrosine-type recombinase/integrase [Paraburkholderia sp. BR14320]|uniref:tyrosine-type recombinase/integrase n=1 Tax=unclassified Paraburkholderia TaxID=2615204 RepID=UPI0034CD15CD
MISDSDFKRQAKQLAPNSHLLIEGCSGLRIEAGNNPAIRSWVYRYNSPVDNRKRQIKFGEWPAMPIAEAIGVWAKLRNERKSGSDVAVEKRAAKPKNVAPRSSGEYTVRRVCDEYLAECIEPHRKSKEANEIARMFDTMLGPMANMRACDITREQAAKLIADHGKRAPVVAGKLRTALSGAWAHALDEGRLKSGVEGAQPPNNWWAVVMRRKLKSNGKKIQGKRVEPERCLSSAKGRGTNEIGQVINWLPNLSQVQQDLLTLYLWTVTRGAETVGMRVSEIKREEDGILWWEVPKQRTKNLNRSRASDLRVPLFGRAEEIVLRRMETAVDGFLFPSSRVKGQHIQQKAIQSDVHYFMPYSKKRPESKRPRWPVTHWAPHDLRRSSNTLLTEIGCPPHISDAIMGHLPPGVRKRYDKAEFNAQRVEWLQKLDVELERLAALAAQSVFSASKISRAVFRDSQSLQLAARGLGG